MCASAATPHDSFSLRARSATAFTMLLWIQGVYFVSTGIWPLASIESFETVTGPKTDHWLVKTVAALVVAIGATLVFAAWRRRDRAEVAVLAVASSLVLAAIDIIYVAEMIIPPIYLADALVEFSFIAGWTIALVRNWRRRL